MKMLWNHISIGICRLWNLKRHENAVKVKVSVKQVNKVKQVRIGKAGSKKVKQIGTVWK